MRSARSSMAPQENTVFDFELDDDNCDDAFRSSSPQPQSSEEDSSSSPTTPEPSSFLTSSSPPSYFHPLVPQDYAAKKTDSSASAVVEISSVPSDYGEPVSANSYSKSNSIWGRRKKDTKDGDEKERGRRAFVGRILDRAANGNEGRTSTLQRIASRSSINGEHISAFRSVRGCLLPK